MVRAACHCGAVRITMQPAPDWVMDCNCSICRRYGVLWAYAWDEIAERDLVTTLVQGADALEAYIWGNRWIGFWRCKACGCLTHHTALDQPDKIRGVNARMFADFDPASVTLHRYDSAHTRRFWTRPDAPIRISPHAFAPPEPGDWR